MTEKKQEDNAGCFFITALLCGVLLLLYVVNNVATGIKQEYEREPGFVMFWVLIIGVISFFIYKAKEKDE